MRISDWSSDVCSSDLGEINHALHRMNTDTRETLKKAQDSYVAIKHLVNSASSSQINLIQAQLDRKSAALNLLGQQLDEAGRSDARSEEHTSELQSLMRMPYAFFCLKKHNTTPTLYKYNNTK